MKFTAPFIAAASAIWSRVLRWVVFLISFDDSRLAGGAATGIVAMHLHAERGGMTSCGLAIPGLLIGISGELARDTDCYY